MHAFIHWCRRQLLQLPVAPQDIQSSAHRTVIPLTTHPCHRWPPGGVIRHVDRALPGRYCVPDEWRRCLVFNARVFCVYFFHIAYVLYYCNTVWWTRCDWSLILRILSSFSALTLLVGSFDRLNPVPDMTKNERQT